MAASTFRSLKSDPPNYLQELFAIQNTIARWAPQRCGSYFVKLRQISRRAILCVQKCESSIVKDMIGAESWKQVSHKEYMLFAILAARCAFNMREGHMDPSVLISALRHGIAKEKTIAFINFIHWSTFWQQHELCWCKHAGNITKLLKSEQCTHCASLFSCLTKSNANDFEKKLEAPLIFKHAYNLTWSSKQTAQTGLVRGIGAQAPNKLVEALRGELKSYHSANLSKW